ncbi:response regulator [Exilibacterium tricleocarpae]|uniref:Chemotaxis protein CheA n=1 Tax=Exilibacterium tricleocarpae TaxID=2591008 RepID=A0A545SXE4_9GAMM|nr:Hpt domain-containing protein [Exilibacterium tricleocarpae]TQV69637.1 response regulator [Exilibacterium tricleocarpae]
MGENRNYAALDWVIGEIGETLTQARQALEAYVEDQNDSTRIRFCLTHIHQVHGSLQMVEFFGAALLAEEMENLAQALMNNTVNNEAEAQEVLMRAILQLPVYLEQVKNTRRDHPSTVLPLLNDLRAVRGESLLTETKLFAPDLSAAHRIAGERQGITKDKRQFLSVAKKLRQMYQYAAAGVIRNVNPEENLAYLNKVFARLYQLTQGTARQPLWDIALALGDGLANDAVEASVSVKNLLRQLDKEIKVLALKGLPSLDEFTSDELIKNMLYYIARAPAKGKHLVRVKKRYGLQEALPETEDKPAEHQELMAAPDPDAVRSVVAALKDELDAIKHALDVVLSGSDDGRPLAEALPIFKRVADTMAVMGIGQLRKQVLALGENLQQAAEENNISQDLLMRVAGEIIEIEHTLEALAAGTGQGGRGAVERDIHIDRAQESVLRESRNGLEQAKDAIIEYIASQWDCDHLANVPKLLGEIRGGLEMVPLPRPARILEACAKYIQEQLLEQKNTPEWSTLDTLADAIASVEYYLERLGGDHEEDDELLLSVAEESVELLGYAVVPSVAAAKPEAVEPIAAVTPEPESAPQPAPELKAVPVAESAVAQPEPEPLSEAAEQEDEDHAGSDIDDEILEIFVEEAGEVLATINEFFPAWIDGFSDEEALTEVRRAFHTLKGSGRMVEAVDIGELAWAIENMLNRVIDETINPNQYVVGLIDRVRQLLPAMVDAFSRKSKNPHPAETELYMDWGASLAKGYTPPALAQEVDTQGAVVEGFTPLAAEPAAEPEPARPALVSADAEEDDADEKLLWEIFGSEAVTHLQVVESYISDMQQAAPLYTPPSDAMQRALHTLKGSAHMADVAPIAELATPLERFVKELRTYQVNIDEDILQLLKDGVSYTREALAQIEQGVTVQIPKLPLYIARIAELKELSVGHLIRQKEATSAGNKKVDPGLLSIFMAEDMNLLLDADKLLQRWQRNGFDSHELLSLVTELQTLEKGAEHANLPPMAHLSAHLRRVYELIDTDPHYENEAVFALLMNGHECLLDMVDAVAAGQNLRDIPAELAQRFESLAAAPPAAAEPELPVLESQELEEPALQESEVPELESEVPALQAEEELKATTPALEQSELPELESHELEVSVPATEEPEAPALEQSELPELESEELEVPALATEEPEALTLEQSELSEPASEELEVPALVTEEPEALTLEQSELSEPASEELQVPALATEEPEAPIPEQTDLPELESEELEVPVLEVEPFEAPELEHVDEVEVSALDSEVPADAPHDEIDTGDDAQTAAPIFADTFADTLDTELEGADIEVHETAQSFDVDVPLETTTSAAAGDGRVQAEADSETGGVTIDDEDGDEIDVEILEIFTEEADELLEEIDESIHEWEEDWDNAGPVEELKRALHTFKGGARLAGLMGIGELAHEFETYLIALNDGGDSVGQASFDRMHDYQDKLLKNTEKVKAKLAGHLPEGLQEVMVAQAQEAAEAPATETADSETAAADSETAAVPEADVEDAAKTAGSADILPFAPKPKAVPAVAAAPSSSPSVPALPETNTPAAASGASQIAARRSGPQEMVKVSSELLEELVNLAGETSISRGRMEEQVSELGFAIDEMESTIQRLQEQLRRLDIETEAQILFRQEQLAEHEDFDPLEMDRYSQLQHLSRALIESASDLMDLKSTLTDKTRDTETLLLQQARINTDLQEGLMRSRMVPFSRLVPRLRRIVRQVAGEVGKQVTFELDNVEGELDRSVLERMVAPLEHMLRNAVDHGIEPADERLKAGKPEAGRIVLSLGREGGDVLIRLADDGQGVNLARVREKAIERGLMRADAKLSDHDILQFILHAGFSTADKVTQISGRGVGMDVVNSEIKQLGGSVFIDSRPGEGSEFVVRLPFTVSVNRALMVEIGDDRYAIPLNTIEGIVRVSPFELEHYYQDEHARFEYAGENYQVRYLGTLLDSEASPKLEGQALPMPVVLVRTAENAVAFQVDSLLGSREIVVKSLGQQFSAVLGLSGATVMGDGSVVVILDLHAMIRQQAALANIAMPVLQKDAPVETEDDMQTVMVVDDSVTVRKVTSRFLEREGYHVFTAKDGADALRLLQDTIPDLMLLDIEMPRMDGFEVAKNVRSSSRLKQIPIIMITSRTGEKHRERALALGVQRYMGKPYQEDALLENIRELIGAEAD